MTADIIDMKDLKTKSADDQAKEKFKEFIHFVKGDMSQEEGSDYMNRIGWNVIFGSDATPLGMIGHTDWGWVDTYNQAVHFEVGEYIKSFTIPPLEEWPLDTQDMLEDCAEFCMTGQSKHGNVNSSPEPAVIH